MLESLFNRPTTVAKYREAPLSEAREQFLEQCEIRGYSRASLKKIAWVLYSIAPRIDINHGKVTPNDIERAVNGRLRFKNSQGNSKNFQRSRQLFVHISTEWVRSLGCFEAPRKPEGPFSAQTAAFAQYLREDRGLSPITISTRCERLNWFFSNLHPSRDSLDTISIADVDTFIKAKGNKGWKRSSLSSLASSLRSFFRYAEGQGWTMPGIAAIIESPRIYALEGLPKGPSWEDVQSLLTNCRGDRPADIRAYAILLLLSVYGLRRSEVAGLQLTDLDWTGEKIMVSRPKQRRIQSYPLIPVAGEAILRYLREARPHSAYRSLFLTLAAPTRPLSGESISPIVRSRLRDMGIVLPRHGAHCLRHACASHLLASGFSLKQIGDHLGHRSANATLSYTKVDLAGLRQVAELDLGGLL